MKYVCMIHNLTVNYEKAPALWDVTTQLPRSLLIAICGPNGAGKSTFLKALLGLIPLSSGTIDFVSGLRIGYMPQVHSIDWNFPLTLFDLVLMGCYGRVPFFSRINRREKERAYLAIKRVGLEGLEHRQISQLSCGQQGRAFFARALLQEADIYFFDEPFAGIDVSSSQVMLELLQQLKAEGKTVVVVHHDLNEVKRSFDWAILLNRRLIGAGEVDQILTEEKITLAYGCDPRLFEHVVQLNEKTAKGFVT